METYIALLRAVNVGGTGKLPMADLRQMCSDLGFEKVQTYIQSGNLVFQSSKDARNVKEILENSLSNYFQRPAEVFIRTHSQLKNIIHTNPFKDCAPNRVIVIFTDDSEINLDGVKHQKDEEIIIGDKAIFVQYGAGMAQSKLIIPAAKTGTGRNLNTINKLLLMAQNNE